MFFLKNNCLSKICDKEGGGLKSQVFVLRNKLNLRNPSDDILTTHKTMNNLNLFILTLFYVQICNSTKILIFLNFLIFTLEISKRN